MEEFLQEKAFELSLAIGVPVAVSIFIFWLQIRSDKKINKIINRMDDLLAQQQRIITTNEQRRINRLKWMHSHVTLLLKTLRKNYEELTERVDAYQKDDSEENLRKVKSMSNISVTISLTHLADIADRDVNLAREYITDSWITTKFLEVIPLLGWGIQVDENKLKIMNGLDLSQYKENIQYQINQIDQHIERLDKELEGIG